MNKPNENHVIDIMIRLKYFMMIRMVIVMIMERIEESVLISHVTLLALFVMSQKLLNWPPSLSPSHING